MENLVVPSKFLNLKSDSNDYPTVYILGDKGYLGSNISEYLKAQSLNVLGLDPRISDLRQYPITRGDWILDCSRLNSFSEFSIREDARNNCDVLDWSRASEARYLRIGSILELDDNAQESPYIFWSRKRTTDIRMANLAGTFGTLLVPNIYGGVGSASIIDLMLERRSTGKYFDLEKPSAFRDFLHLEYLLATIRGLIKNFDRFKEDQYAITSGVCYQVGSIRNFLHSNRISDLVSKEIEYDCKIEFGLYPDKLLNYIKNY